MIRTLLRQSQIDPTYGDLVGYGDDLAIQLDAVNGPETVSGTSLITGEAITFSISGNTVTLAVTNPKTSGVVPGDDILISGSTSDDGTYQIVSVTAGTVVIDHTFTAGDGSYAVATFKAVRNAMTDLNFLRAQLRRIINESDWFSPATAGNSPVLQQKKVIYSTEITTDVAIPTAAFANIAGLSLPAYADQADLDAEGVLASTSLPTAGGDRKSEGKHWVDVVDAATGAPITIAGNRVYGYIVVDDIDTPTTESVYFVY